MKIKKIIKNRYYVRKIYKIFNFIKHKNIEII